MNTQHNNNITSSPTILPWKPIHIVALVSTLLMLLLFYRHNHEYFWIEASFMIIILVLTSFTRTVSTRFALSAFAGGVVISAGVTLIVWNILDAAIGIYGTSFGQVIMSIVEEVMKLVPMLLLGYLLYTRKKYALNISDMLLLAVFGGAGFSLMEKSYWDGVYFPFTYGPHLGDLYLFPDALGVYVSGGDRLGYIGHAAAAGFIAMGIGLGLYYKKKGQMWWWVLPVVMAVWILFEHILSNLYYVNGTEALGYLGGGMLTPYLFILALIGCVVVDWRGSRGASAMTGVGVNWIRQRMNKK